jgi:hypothetical protein
VTEEPGTTFGTTVTSIPQLENKPTMAKIKNAKNPFFT